MPLDLTYPRSYLYLCCGGKKSFIASPVPFPLRVSLSIINCDVTLWVSTVFDKGLTAPISISMLWCNWDRFKNAQFKRAVEFLVVFCHYIVYFNGIITVTSAIQKIFCRCLIRLLCCSGQNKRIAPFPFFHGCRKRIMSKQRSHLRWTAIRWRWAYHLSRLQYF
jgi:hypothetical protein